MRSNTTPGRRDARALCVALFDAVADERQAQVRQVDLVAELIDVHDATEGVVLPGSERLVPAGADGTPDVAEFLAVELAPLLGVDVASAWNLIRDVANLRHRHPHTWQALHDGRVFVWQARALARDVATAGLDAAAAAWVDARIAGCLGRLSWGRVMGKLRGLVVRADTALAAARAEARRTERFVRIRHEPDGMSLLVARTTTAAALELDAALGAAALQRVADGSAAPLEALKADALADLAAGVLVSGQVPRPKATLVVHLAGASVTEPGVARVEGLGPVLTTDLAALLGRHRVQVQPVIDLNDDPGVDSYEIPERIRRHVRLREPFDVFPFSSRRSPGLDLDHTTPFDHASGAPPGQTRASNLGPTGRTPHRARTHAGWQVTQPEPGAYEWVSRFGFRYRVTRGASHRLRPPDAEAPARARLDLLDLAWSSRGSVLVRLP